MKQEDIIKKIKLPSLDTFEGTGKDKCPYIKLFEFIADELKMDLSKIGVSGAILTYDDEKYLYELVKKWCRKYHKIPKKTLDFEVGMYRLNIGPSNFNKNDNWAEKGYVYITNNINIDKE